MTRLLTNARVGFYTAAGFGAAALLFALLWRVDVAAVCALFAWAILGASVADDCDERAVQESRRAAKRIASEVRR